MKLNKLIKNKFPKITFFGKFSYFIDINSFNKCFPDILTSPSCDPEERRKSLYCDPEERRKSLSNVSFGDRSDVKMLEGDVKS